MSEEVQKLNPHIKEPYPEAKPEMALTEITSPIDLRKRMAEMKAMIELKKEFLRDNMKKGIHNDYAEIPGCGDKKVILKPGAEKLLDWFGLYADPQLLAEKEDWEKQIFAYTYRVYIKKKGTNIVAAICDADCSTMETKYRFEWKFANQLPPGTDTATLESREVGSGERKYIQYRFPIDNPVDKRNTVRKQAQIRAIRGGAVLATATSDLFDLGELDEQDSPTGNGHDAAASTPPSASAPAKKKADYGNVISEKQGKRLYAIRRSNEISDDKFKQWLKARYGLDSDKEIGYKIYDAICKACELGRLDMPEDDEPEAPQPQEAPENKPTDAVLSIDQIKELSLLLHSTRKSHTQFMDWLVGFDPSYTGGGNLNNIKQADFENIKTAWQKAVAAGVV